MTKRVDSNLLGEHVRSMGCEFVEGRVELAPQIFQAIEDVIGLVEDLSSELMTTSTTEQLAAPENHCATESVMSLLPGSVGHRLAGDNCRGGDEVRERSLNRQREYNYVD